jgi:thymidine kinase
MFLEPYINPSAHTGWIEVICGSMFSGKTEELIRRINRALIAKQEVRIFKPALDTRYDEQKVVSHNRNAVHSYPIAHSEEIIPLAVGCEVVGIDEAQFFDDQLPAVVNELANKGIRVIIAGLDMDYAGVPFGVMPKLLSMAEFVTKVHAICVCCGNLASYSYRLNPSHEQLLLGEKDQYEPRCRNCFQEGMELSEKKSEKMALSS